MNKLILWLRDKHLLHQWMDWIDKRERELLNGQYIVQERRCYRCNKVEVRVASALI